MNRIDRGALLPFFFDRRGMTIVLALIFLAVAFALAVGVEFYSRNERALSYHAHYSEVAYQAGLSGCRAALQYYAEVLNDPESAPYRKLADRSVDRVDLPAFTPDRHAELAELLKDYAGIEVQVEGELTDLLPLSLNGPVDPREKKGAIRLVARVKYREVRKTVTLRRRFRFVSAAPPVVSRFTLFLSEPDATRINNLAQKSDGTCDGGKPFTLFNGEGCDLKRNGWIYLGEEPLLLNLGRGEEGYGEDFVLPDTITRSLFFPNPNYTLLHLNTGFYDLAGDDPVFKYFPVKSEFRASCLRLFGCRAVNPAASPTLVVGNVWRRYLQAAAVSPLQNGQLVRIVPMPWVMFPEDIPTDPAFPPFLFLSTDLYQVYMSQAREEPFNRSYDYLIADGESPPPLYLKKELGAALGQVYPLANAPITLTSAAGDQLYAGRLKDLDLPRALRERAGRTFATLAECLAERAEGEPGANAIHLAGVYRILEEKADLAARGPLTVSGAGILLFDKSVRVGDVRLANPARDVCSIVSLGGDLAVGANEVQAGLAAPAGEVIPAGPRIKGFLAARRIDPDNLKKGGSVEYDPRFNPSGPLYARCYVFDASPGLLEFEEAAR